VPRAVEAARKELEEAAKQDDRAKIEAALAAFQKSAQKLGEVLHAQNAAGGAESEGQGDAEGGPEAGSSSTSNSGDEPVDADFEVKT
jgi:hypothetical protein